MLLFQEFDQLFLSAAENKSTNSAVHRSRMAELALAIAPGDEKTKRLVKQWLDNDFLQDLIILHSHLMHQKISPESWKNFGISTLDASKTQKQISKPLILIAENIRSAYNVGALFRLAECAGVSQLILTGYTCTPANNHEIGKTGLGTEITVPWSWTPDSRLALRDLRKEGIPCFGLETMKDAVDLTQSRPQIEGTIALLVGNERWGIAPTSLDKLDGFFRLPTMGMKNSLNVVQAATIAVYLLQFL